MKPKSSSYCPACGLSHAEHDSRQRTCERLQAALKAAAALPRTFATFPADSICPICHTNDAGQTVLVPICGTGDGRIAEAKPIHLACAVILEWDEGLGVGFVWPKES